MPKPVYQLCASNVSIDRESNSLSVFSVIERVVIEAFLPPQGDLSPKMAVLLNNPPVVSFSGRVVVVWLAEDADHGEEFEQRFSIVSPNGSELLSLNLPNFKMDTSTKSPLFRQLVGLQSLPPMCESGVWYMVTRIRKANSEDNSFAVQQSPLIVDFVEKEAPPEMLAKLQ